MRQDKNTAKQQIMTTYNEIQETYMMRQEKLCHLCAGDVQASLDLPHPQSNPNCLPVSSTQHALGLGQGVDSTAWTAINGCLLVFMLVALRLLTYLALRHKTTQL